MEENKKELDQTGRLTAILLSAMEKEGINDPGALCSETMNVCTRIFCIVSELMQEEPKSFTLKLLKDAVRQIEEQPAPVPTFEIEK